MTTTSSGRRCAAASGASSKGKELVFQLNVTIITIIFNYDYFIIVTMIIVNAGNHLLDQIAEQTLYQTPTPKASYFVHLCLLLV